MKIKKGRYLLFMYYGFYPNGGFEDFQFSFNTYDEFVPLIEGDFEHGSGLDMFDPDYVQVFDTDKFEVTDIKFDKSKSDKKAFVKQVVSSLLEE